jgi:hypothetical protein
MPCATDANRARPTYAWVVEQPFSTVVTSGPWRAEAEEWIRARLTDVGVVIDAEIAQPRVRAWSTQLAVPTRAGTMWFKANCPGLSFEPAVHEELARIVPEEVDPPIAVDRERGWMITRDRGFTIADTRTPTSSDWTSLVRAAALLQRMVASHRDVLCAAGLPNCSPETVPERFDRMLRLLSDLPEEHPARLRPETVDRIARVRPDVVRAAKVLDSSPLGATFQHGDLHPGNAFPVSSGTRIFDFGDAQWAHPVEALCVPQEWVTTLTDLPWEPVLDAFAEVWSDLVTLDDVEELLRAAFVTQPVNRSATWWDALADASPEEMDEWGKAPAHHLKRLLGPHV